MHGKGSNPALSPKVLHYAQTPPNQRILSLFGSVFGFGFYHYSDRFRSAAKKFPLVRRGLCEWKVV